MAIHRLTRRAAADLDEIFDYTARQFGLAQARAYLDGINSLCEQLAANPLIGRSAESLAPGLRRYEFRSHVLFYTTGTGGVVIVRVLHSKMDALRHL